MTSKTGHQIVTIYILPKSSRSRDNTTMKFGQLTECNMENIFLKYYTYWAFEILSISPDQQSEMLYSLFLLYVQDEVYQNIVKLRCWSIAFTL